MNRRSLWNVVATSVLAGLLAACSSSSSSEESEKAEKKEHHDDRTSTSSWWGDNMRGYWYVLKRDGTDLYRSIDRHFFNYDWEDPYIN